MRLMLSHLLALAMPMKITDPPLFATVPQFGLHCLWGWEYISTAEHMLYVLLYPFAFVFCLIIYWGIRGWFGDGHPVPPEWRWGAAAHEEKPGNLPVFTGAVLFNAGFWTCYALGWYEFLWAVTAWMMVFPVVYGVVAVLMFMYIDQVGDGK